VILIGTSGWSYDDWAGEFYPRGLGKDKRLEYYARYFHTTEINSTYYRFPTASMVKGWITSASKLDDFEYSLKMPGRVTHESLLLDRDHALEFEFKAVAPLNDAGCLGAVLIQLSPYLMYSDKGQKTDHLERLKMLLERLETSKYNYAVEFRHGSWLEHGRLNGETLDMMKERGVAVCAIDGPSIPPILENTARHAYFRFHGRNDDIWYKKSPEDDRMNRYDYNYKEEELAPWRKRVKAQGGMVRAYFNNHPHANAVKNAKLFETIMGIPGVPLKLEKQSELSSFF
jgi:uncharacterized protein YecE (DUF72 family)